MDASQGNADVQELLDGGPLSPAAQVRLDAATALSPDQRAALERGELVLPQEQMEYLTAMSRGLDSKTTAEIRSLTATPGGDALTTAMRLAANQHVAGDGGTRGAPLRGGLANAPARCAPSWRIRCRASARAPGSGSSPTAVWDLIPAR